MNMRLHLTPRAALFVFICFLLVCPGLYAQQEQQEQQEQEKKTGREYKPREQKLYIDIPLTIGEITLINMIGNIDWRLWGADSETAYVTIESMRDNLKPQKWLDNFELGRSHDTFLVNQFIHPYAGGLYFTSARSNNLNFYWSIFSPVLGSFIWEALCEIESPSASDFINTVSGGIVVGEILHRLYIELDKGRIAGKIGATILSPIDRLTAFIRGYGPEKGPGKIRDLSLAFGFSWINSMFFDGDELRVSWNTGSAFINIDLVYDDPYTAHSKTPFDQFDLNTSLMVTIPLIYNLSIIADGYLASWILADDEVDQASNGLTLHFDGFVTDSGGVIEINDCRDNLDFSANSLGYSVKWRRILNKSLEFSLKTHLGFSPWAVTDYNSGLDRLDNNLYLFGGIIKLFMELRQIKEDDGALPSGALSSGAKNGHALSLSLCFYDTWNYPNISVYDANTLFLFSKIAYSFPLTGRLSLYAADNFMLLYCNLTRDAGAELPDMTRWYNCAQFGLKISFL